MLTVEHFVIFLKKIFYHNTNFNNFLNISTLIEIKGKHTQSGDLFISIYLISLFPVGFLHEQILLRKQSLKDKQQEIKAGIWNFLEMSRAALWPICHLSQNNIHRKMTSASTTNLHGTCTSLYKWQLSCLKKKFDRTDGRLEVPTLVLILNVSILWEDRIKQQIKILLTFWMCPHLLQSPYNQKQHCQIFFIFCWWMTFTEFRIWLLAIKMTCMKL